MTNLQYEEQTFIIAAYNKLTKHEEIVEFMLQYFKSYIILRSKKDNLDFKDTVDNSTKELMIPVKQALELAKENLTDSVKTKIRVWTNAYDDFQKRIVAELVKISKKL